MNRERRPVAMIDREHNILDRWPNIVSAVRATGYTTNQIRRRCYGLYKMGEWIDDRISFRFLSEVKKDFNTNRPTCMRSHPIVLMQNGGIVTIYPNAVTAAEKLGISCSTVINRCKGVGKRKVILAEYDMRWLKDVTEHIA